MGCSTAKFTRVGNGVSSTFSLVEDGLQARFTKAGGMSVRFGLVCGTNIGDGFLFASDGILLTIEDGKLKVAQQ